MKNSPAAFRATYSDLKLIKTRQCVQIVFELPLADFDAAYSVLGGLPDNSKETWFAIAPLRADKPEKAKPDRRDWRELQPAAQAGIRCSEAPFWAFLNETRNYQISNPDEAAEAVREICGITSRIQLNGKHAARVIWHQLDDEFLAWKYVVA